MKSSFPIAAFLFSANSYTQQVTGKLENFPSTSFSIRHNPDIITMRDDTVHVNEKGEFIFAFKMNCPAIVRLSLPNKVGKWKNVSVQVMMKKYDLNNYPLYLEKSQWIYD